MVNEFVRASLKALNKSLDELLVEKLSEKNQLNKTCVVPHLDAPQGKTYCRYNKYLQSAEWLASWDSILNVGHWRTNQYKSLVFPDTNVLSLNRVRSARLSAQIEKVNLPDSDKITASIFILNAYEQDFNFYGRILVKIGVPNGSQGLKEVDIVEKNYDSQVSWRGVQNAPRAFIQEFVMDVEVDPKWRGKEVTILCEVLSDTNVEKYGWHFEGFAVVLNSTRKFKKGEYFQHKDAI